MTEQRAEPKFVAVLRRCGPHWHSVQLRAGKKLRRSKSTLKVIWTGDDFGHGIDCQKLLNAQRRKERRKMRAMIFKLTHTNAAPAFAEYAARELNRLKASLTALESGEVLTLGAPPVSLTLVASNG